MNSQETEAAFKKEAEQLKSDLKTLREEFARFKSELLTPDQYVRYERLPQLVGAGITHTAGSQEASVDVEDAGGVPSTRQILAGTGITGGGDLSADRTVEQTPESVVQLVRVSENGTPVSESPELDFLDFANVVFDVTANAGVNEVEAEAELDRWEYADPNYGTPGSGYNFIDATTAGSATVLGVIEEGKLLSIGLLCGASDSSGWGGSETVDADLRITIDGGTPTNLPLASGGAAGWDAWAIPWTTNALGSFSTNPRWGTVQGDSFALDLNFEYRTSLKIELVVNSTTNLSGDTLLWFCYTHRARLA